jgi:hypothetical protein
VPAGKPVSQSAGDAITPSSLQAVFEAALNTLLGTRKTKRGNGILEISIASVANFHFGKFLIMHEAGRRQNGIRA